MFDSILEGNKPLRRVGRGAMVSLMVHVVLVGLVVVISIRMGKKGIKTALTAVTFVQAKPVAPPPPPPPPPRASRRPRRQIKPVTPIDTTKTLVKAKENAETSTEEKNDTKDEDDDGGQEGGVAGGVKGGVVGGVVGGQLGGKLGGQLQKAAAIPFGAGMTRPQKISGKDPVYTREALAAKIEGLMIVRCVITVEGKLEGCKVIKPLPYMEKAVLEALATHQYTPVTFQGKPVSVNYVFNIKLVIP
jgi:periplasmic protein TonB